MNKKAQAFTIVELLIVIVVIAILAAISIAAYTNIQQRAKNTAIINAASQSLKMIQAYIAENGAYPLKGSACITIDSGCQTLPDADSTISANLTFNANMATIGTLPKSVPTEGSRLYGVTYIYSSPATYNGKSQPASLRYALSGKNQQCRLPGVEGWVASNTYVNSTTGYYYYQAALDKTECVINIPGPEHS